MHALFIANFELDENEGIYKKVDAEASAIGAVLGTCDLITRFKRKTKVRCADGTIRIEEKKLLEYVTACIEKGNVDFLYIRHMIPSIELIFLLRNAKKKKISIYYEIPTYPYFGEQLKASRRKYRAIIKIGLDIVFWPLIYKYIDKLVVIRSNTKAKKYSKMVEITNGVQTKNIIPKNYSTMKDDMVFRMVAVGTLYPYHGYDRVIKGLKECGEKVFEKTVEFHIIGNSQTIDELHEQVNKLGLKHVVFHGVKTTDELNCMYDTFDVGLGCLALHRRNADIDTTLKIIEYYCRGVPVVTSGISPMDLIDKEYTINIQDDEKTINIEDIYCQYSQIDQIKLQQLSIIAKKTFDWNYIMSSLVGEVK